MESFLSVIEVLAVLAFAYSGVIEARRSGFDYVGILTVAIVSAFGGGTLRDVLLDRHPLYWIEHWTFLIYIFLFSLAELLLIRRNKDFSSNKSVTLTDALGLGLFCASGVGIALEMKVALLPAFSSVKEKIHMKTKPERIEDKGLRDRVEQQLDWDPQVTSTEIGVGRFHSRA